MDALKTRSYVITDNGISYVIVLTHDWDESNVARTEDVIDHASSSREVFQLLDEAGIYYSVFLETNKSAPEIIRWIEKGGQ